MSDNQDSDDDLLLVDDPTSSPPTTRWSQQLSALPAKLLQRLMLFQKEGVEFAISKNGRCMIADEMGLGKTVQAIAAAYVYRGEWPLLVVVPSSLRYPWIEELERWLPELEPGDINLVESKSHVAGIGNSKVTVLGYGLLTTDARPLLEALSRQKFAVVVVDESHYLKSRNAARTKILVPLIQSAKRALLLTGTPALGRPEELFMQIDALYPKRFGTWSEYAKKYCNAHFRYFGRHRQWDCRGASNLDDLHQRLNQVMIRRLKDQVLRQLPPKVRQRIPFDLPKDSGKEALASMEQYERLLKMVDSGASASDNPFTEVMSLVTRMYKQTAIAKAGAVKDYIKLMLETEQLKFLVFAHHLTMLQACTEAVVEAKVGYIRIDGSVPSSERVQLVHKFQNDPATRVAVLSIQAAGQGLTFTAASHVVFAELYWNPGHVKQAEDRAHRIGQTSSVHVHYLIAKGTFDTVMWSMLNRKETVTGSTLNGRKEYLKAEEGDKTKWEFLNFAQAWTPSEMLLPSPEGTQTDDKDGTFFTHFEKNKQHDIRTFFTPAAAGTKKKRKRIVEEDEVEEEEGEIGRSPAVLSLVAPSDAAEAESDSSPVAKRLRTPRLGRTPASSTSSRRQPPGKPRSSRSKAPPALMAPRRLSERVAPGPSHEEERWTCGACTYANSSLLTYCEVCETPCSAPGPGTPSPSPPNPSVSKEPVEPPNDPRSPLKDRACVVLSDSDGEGGGRREEEEEASEGKRARGVTAGPADDEGRHTPVLARGSVTADQTEGPVAGESVSESQPTPNRNAAAGHNDDDGDDDDEAGADGASSSLPLYPGLLFCASRNTDRIYLYTKDGDSLGCNFDPLDIELGNWEDLPEAFQRRRENRSQVVRFVRDWGFLTAMKQRLLRRSGLRYRSPAQGLEAQASAQRPHSSTKRYLGKEDVAQASLAKVQQEGGSTRLVTKETFFNKRRSASTLSPPATARQQNTDSSSEIGGGAPSEPGYLQALDNQGVPLCLCCQQPCPPSADDNAWDSRFCTQRCQEDFQLRSSQSHMRARVLEAESGVCQQCGLAARQLYLKVRDAPPARRKELLENTWLAQLPLKQLNEIIRAPVEGDFWQVDHIRPVYSGGGQCSLDNLQTLCTVCHRTRTAQQAKERSQSRKAQAASRVASSIGKFFRKR